MYAFLIASVIARPRRASFLFVMVATLFQKLCSNLDGSIYFFLAAFCDFAVVGILYRFGTSRKSLDMMLISIVSMLINLMGWFLWFFYRPLDIYAATFTMLKKDSDDAGGIAVHIDNSGHRSHVGAGCRVVH
ncbi:hypothetical protein PQZ63_gp16 [Klebsiella phage pKp383]|uniref:hypothetical protein n=1 Tax=Klebsiella phage pKp383 TaxID=2961985 RepID=UPI00232B171A|nr:hypothetical protein PQZ63_gp16 [Klebsiella phage pKp383]UVD41513.1 hypothetical protein [Klebsiella phage pKp383]